MVYGGKASPLFAQSDILSCSRGELSCSHTLLRSKRGSTFYTQLEIKALRDIAFVDIQSKVTSANVIAEFFSGFTSR